MASWINPLTKTHELLVFPCSGTWRLLGSDVLFSVV